MALGMSYHDYWYGDVWMAKAYVEAEQIRQKRRVEQVNAEAHLMGLYVYEALCDVSPVLHAFAKKGTKPVPFSSKPYRLEQKRKELTPEEQQEKEDREVRMARAYMMQMDAAFKRRA